MSDGGPRPLPAASDADRTLTLGALGAIVAGFIAAGRWFGAGAPPDLLADSSLFPIGAFACGVAVRALGAFLTRYSDRTGVIAAGDTGAFLVFALIAATTGVQHDSSGSVGLALAIGLSFGLPFVALLSSVSATAARFRRARGVIYSIAFLFGILGAVGYGTTFWS